MSSSNANAKPSSNTPRDARTVSDYQAVKDAGYRHFLHFYQSYGFKDVTNDDDLAEAKAIRKGLKEQMYEDKPGGFVVEPDNSSSSPRQNST